MRQLLWPQVGPILDCLHSSCPVNIPLWELNLYLAKIKGIRVAVCFNINIKIEFYCETFTVASIMKSFCLSLVEGNIKPQTKAINCSPTDTAACLNMECNL